MAKQAQTQEKRGRGRPSAFPGQEMTPFLTRIPESAKRQLDEIAEARGENLNVLIARMIGRMHGELNRRKSAAPAPKAD